MQLLGTGTELYLVEAFLYLGVHVLQKKSKAGKNSGILKFYYWVKNKTGSILRFDSVRSSYVQVLDFVMIISLKH